MRKKNLPEVDFRKDVLSNGDVTIGVGGDP